MVALGCNLSQFALVESVARFMSTVDQFESVFKAAAKTIYVHGSFLWMNRPRRPYLQLVRTFLQTFCLKPRWIGFWFRKMTSSVRVEEHRPDLVVTYRNLKSDAWRGRLGEHLGLR